MPPKRTINRKTRAFQRKLSLMRRELWPLVNVCSGEMAADFPRTVLHFWLLTEAQLNALAEFYDQRYPGPYTRCYPNEMGWREGARLEVKRRKFGKFIGLRGCESPVWERFEERAGWD